jgi:hypothetical protein
MPVSSQNYSCPFIVYLADIVIEYLQYISIFSRGVDAEENVSVIHTTKQEHICPIILNLVKCLIWRVEVWNVRIIVKLY